MKQGRQVLLKGKRYRSASSRRFRSIEEGLWMGCDKQNPRRTHEKRAKNILNRRTLKSRQQIRLVAILAETWWSTNSEGLATKIEDNDSNNCNGKNKVFLVFKKIRVLGF